MKHVADNNCFSTILKAEVASAKEIIGEVPIVFIQLVKKVYGERTAVTLRETSEIFAKYTFTAEDVINTVGKWTSLSGHLLDVRVALNGFVDFDSAEIVKYIAWAADQTKLLGRLTAALASIMPVTRGSVEQLCSVASSPQLKACLSDVEPLRDVTECGLAVDAMKACITDQLVRWVGETLRGTLRFQELVGASQLATGLPTVRMKANTAHAKEYASLHKLAVVFCRRRPGGRVFRVGCQQQDHLGHQRDPNFGNFFGSSSEATQKRRRRHCRRDLVGGLALQL